MDKEREISGVKVFVSNESYNQYKGTLQEKINDLQQRIDKAVEYIKEWQSFPHTNCTTHKELKNLSNILKGDNND